MTGCRRVENACASCTRRHFVTTTPTTAPYFVQRPPPPLSNRSYVCMCYIYVYKYRPLPRFDLAGQSHRERQTRVLFALTIFGETLLRGKKCSSWLLVRPIPMRKANPAFCDRSKSHKKLDPFDDRKMVHWLAENPFLVRSSAISVRVPMTALVYACACVRACAADMSLDVAPHLRSAHARTWSHARFHWRRSVGKRKNHCFQSNT